MDETPVTTMRIPWVAHVARSGSWNAPWLWFAVVLLWALCFQGTRSLWEPDEGRYSAVAVQMLRGGDWLVPAAHHEQPHLTKPPLTYWVLAGSLRVFGRSAWAIRVPNALAFAATATLVGLLARRLLRCEPWKAVAIFATLLLPFVAHSVVTTDTVLSLWETFGMLACIEAWREPRKGRRELWRIIAGLAFGFAFLTKGPPGLLPLLGWLLFRAAVRAKPATWLRPRQWLPPLLVLAIPVLGWAWLLERRLPGVIAHLWSYEVVDRAASTIHGRNGRWYGWIVVYVPALLLGSLPWIWFCRSRLRRAPDWLRPSVWREHIERDPELLLLLLWFAVPVVLLCLARSRLPFYLLPSFVPLALLFTRALAADGVFESRAGRITLLAALVLLPLSKAGASLRVPHADARDYAQFVRTALAQEPRRSAPRQISEVAFVNLHPHYGLELYLDVEVESLSLKEGQVWEGGLGLQEDLRNELRRRENRVFLVSANWAARFEQECAEEGVQVRLLGEREGERLYGER